jgi:hypothetical protein
MNIVKVPILFFLPLLLFVFGGKCDRSNFNYKSLNESHFAAYTVNLTEIAEKSANSKDTLPRGIHAFMKESDGEKRFPAYIRVMSGTVSPQPNSSNQVSCRPLSLVGEIGKEADWIMKDLANPATPNNIILLGPPGIDTDTRIFVIADRIASGCTDVPDALKDRSIIAIDFAKLKEESRNDALTPTEYLDFIKAIIDEFGRKNSIFYISNIDDLLSSEHIKVNPLLNLFLDYNANVIIESTREKFQQNFNPSLQKKVSTKSLHDFTVSELRDYLTEVYKVEERSSQVIVSPAEIDNIARLTKAFAPGIARGAADAAPGVLDVSMRVLAQVIEDARNNRIKNVDTQMVYEAVALNTLSNNRAEVTVSKSDVMKTANQDGYISDGAIDLLVGLEPKYFFNEKSREAASQKIAQALDSKFRDLNNTLGDLQTALSGLSGISTTTIAQAVASLGATLKEIDKNATDNNEKAAEISALIDITSRTLLSVETIATHSQPLALNILTIQKDMFTFLNDANQSSEKNYRLTRELDSRLADITSLIEADINQTKSLQTILNNFSKTFQPGGGIHQAFVDLNTTIQTEMLVQLSLLHQRFASGGEYAINVQNLLQIANATGNTRIQQLAARFANDPNQRGDIAQLFYDLESTLQAQVIDVLTAMLTSLTTAAAAGETPNIADQMAALKSANKKMDGKLATLVKALNDSSTGVNEKIALVESTLQTEVVDALTAMLTSLESSGDIANQVKALKSAYETMKTEFVPLTGKINNSTAIMGSFGNALKVNIFDQFQGMLSNVTNATKSGQPPNIANQMKELGNNMSVFLTELQKTLDLFKLDPTTGKPKGDLVRLVGELETHIFNLRSDLEFFPPIKSIDCPNWPAPGAQILIRSLTNPPESGDVGAECYKTSTDEQKGNKTCVFFTNHSVIKAVFGDSYVVDAESEVKNRGKTLYYKCKIKYIKQ